MENKERVHRVLINFNQPLSSEHLARLLGLKKSDAIEILNALEVEKKAQKQINSGKWIGLPVLQEFDNN